MINTLAGFLFAGAGLVAVVAIVWEVRRHWPDIVRLAAGREAEPIRWVEWRIVEGRPVDFLPESTNDEDLAA